jgi:hypothetical protein
VISYAQARMVLHATLTYAREQVLVGALTAPAEDQVVPITSGVQVRGDAGVSGHVLADEQTPSAGVTARLAPGFRSLT